MTISETVKWFNSIFDINKSENQTKSDFCIGVASDIECVKKQYGTISLLGTAKCDSLDVARKLIELMRTEGFEFPHGEMVDDVAPVFVYLYKKPNK